MIWLVHALNENYKTIMIHDSIKLIHLNAIEVTRIRFEEENISLTPSHLQKP